ncbi:polysaccharide lyase [Actinokineospora guangxiensis]|uniref:Polysaccharide lyase n=1 Tax=Actinokineospora guangxiensis TaxID=1490288 RepID=A0ABW0EVK6_9PSEU
MGRRRHIRRAVCVAGAVTAVALAPQSAAGQPDSTGEVGASAVRGTFAVDFNRWSTGPYPESGAAEDFGNVSSWDPARIMVSGGRLRATLEPGRLSGDGGTLWSVDVTDGTEYEMRYTVNFHSRFDWSRGGKVGWGFQVGDGASGCTRANGDGGSLRLMWYTNDAGRTYLQPYLYHAAMPSNCGDNYGKSYPATGSLQRATNYTVTMRIKSNTGANRDGRAVITVNGVTLLDTPVQWTDNDVKRQIRHIWSHSFRGGSQDYWTSDTVGYIYYDDFSIRRIG